RDPPHLTPPSFPTRRSSDLELAPRQRCESEHAQVVRADIIQSGHKRRLRIRRNDSLSAPTARQRQPHVRNGLNTRQRAQSLAQSDRKSTRLNSSHDQISYAV